MEGSIYWQTSKSSFQDSLRLSNGVLDGIDDRNWSFQYNYFWDWEELIQFDFTQIKFQLFSINQFIEGLFLFLLMFSTLYRIAAFVILFKIFLWAALGNPSDVTQALTASFVHASEIMGAVPMFLDKRLEALYEERNWNGVVKLTDQVLSQHRDYRGSFKFWYYRALGECAQLKIQSCAKSHLSASLFAGEQYRTSIEKMAQFLNLFKSKTKQEQEQIEIGSKI